jgi:hypothetical protein
MVLKKKYDFNILKENNINACTIYRHHQDGIEFEKYKNVLESINLFNRLDEITFCWCSSFILNKENINLFYNITQNIILTIRKDSEASERYLARILYELNNYLQQIILLCLLVIAL